MPTAHNYWELVRGAQGSLISVRHATIDQNLPNSAYSTYYLDDATPPGDMCTGDTAAYGVSGLRLIASIANTDPRFAPYSRFRGRRVLTYRAPGATVADARIVRRQVEAPLVVTARRLSGFAPHDFPDVPPGAFYEDALSWAFEAGVVTGYPDGRFGPRDPVTRGQVVNLFWAMVGRPTGAPPHGFPDVPPGAFYGDALDWARHLGLVTGFSDGRYRPRDPVTRGQS